MEDNPSRKANSRPDNNIFRLLWKPGCSSPCSQEPATGSYSEPDESNPHPPTLFI
jgi:hypothetical protein